MFDNIIKVVSTDCISEFMYESVRREIDDVCWLFTSLFIYYMARSMIWLINFDSDSFYYGKGMKAQYKEAKVEISL